MGTPAARFGVLRGSAGEDTSSAAVRIVSTDRPRSLVTFVASDRRTMHYAPTPGLVIFPLRHFPREKQRERDPFDASVGTPWETLRFHRRKRTSGRRFNSARTGSRDFPSNFQCPGISNSPRRCVTLGRTARSKITGGSPYRAATSPARRAGSSLARPISASGIGVRAPSHISSVSHGAPLDVRGWDIHVITAAETVAGKPKE